MFVGIYVCICTVQLRNKKEPYATQNSYLISDGMYNFLVGAHWIKLTFRMVLNQIISSLIKSIEKISNIYYIKLALIIRDIIKYIYII